MLPNISRLTITALFLVLLPLAMFVEARGQTPVRKIVYLRNVPVYGAIWIMNMDGTGQTQLCSCSGVERPVISPDGLKVAFEMGGNIWVVNTDGTGLFNVTQGRGNYIEYASWGSNSTQIIFDMAVATTDIYRVNIDGTNLTKLTLSGYTNSQGEYVGGNGRGAWSPDGRRIAYYSWRWKEGQEVSAMFVMYLSGGEVKVGKSRTAHFHPVWSPDGSRIVALGGEDAFDCGPNGKAGLYVMSASGGSSIRVTDCNSHNGPNYYAAWSPNSKKLAYQLGGKLYTMNANGSSKKVVSSRSSTYDAPIWTPDGTRLIFAYDNYPIEAQYDLYSVNANGTNLYNLTNTPIGNDVQPVLGRGSVCELPAVSPLPIQTVGSPWGYDLNGVNPNWSMTVEISASDGIVLRDVQLGARYLARKLSVPYYTLETSAFAKQRGKLKPNSTDSSMRSRLVDYSVTPDDEKLVIEGTYAIDQIGQSCLQITQRYEFYKQGVGGNCEPTGSLPCSRWTPSVYYIFSPRAGETISSINIAQRQHITVDNNLSNTIGLFKDCDNPPWCGMSRNGTSYPGAFLFERKANPLYHESYARAIKDGQNGNEWDNIHQTYLAEVDEPAFCLTCGPGTGFFRGGCPECAHSHWRWTASAHGHYGDGRILGIPDDSKQNLDFAVVRYHSDEEDPIDFKSLTQPQERLRTNNTSGRDPLQIFRGTAPEEVVAWYGGTSQQNSDTFFGHGGFFNPSQPSKQLYANASGGDRVSAIVASQIYDAGSTNIANFDPALAGPLPAGYTQYGNLSYDITSTGESSAPNTVTFSIPSVTDQSVFNSLRVFHVEQDPYDPDAVVWVDRTVLPPDPQAPDFASKTINAKTGSLGQFVVAALTDPQPPNTNIADLAITTNASPDPVAVGNNLTYTLSISNNGPHAATGVKLGNTLPPSTDFVSVTSDHGTCKYSAGSVVCKLASINSGSAATVTIVTMAGDGGLVIPPQGEVIINTAHVLANEGDGNSVNNTVETSTLVLPDSNVAPTVNITSPSNGNVFVGPANISIVATALDTDGTISSVEFLDNGQSIGLGTLSGTDQYTLNLTNVPFGNHSFIAMATDNAGKKTFSNAANILVNGLANVGITSPAAGSVFTAPATVSILASAWYGSGSNVITKVDLYANGSFIGTGTYNGSQYSFTWTNVYSGSHLLTAVATDDAGIVTVSNPVEIDVNLRVNQSPSVSITTPANNATFTTPASVTMTATASDSDGSVTGVDFYGDGALLGSGTASGQNQYSFTWSNVAFGNHTLTAVAADNEGATTNSTDVTIKVVSPVLFVAGSTTLNSSDAAVKARLEALNHSVTVKDAASATTADANGKALVVISSTVNPTSVGTKFRTVAVPVITWESGSFNNMGMTGSTNKDFGTKTNQTQVSITNPSHPLAAGLSGNTTVVTAAKTFDWGKPNANAISVATILNDTSKTAIFAYETGATMPGLVAPARRVGLFLYDDTAASFNSNGTALLDAAIKWARGGGSVTGSLVVVPTGLVDLTAQGVLDWTHWGLNGPNSFNHKSGVAPKITNFTLLGTGALGWFMDSSNTFSWTDGTPTLSASSTQIGVNTNGVVGNGFEISLPADTALKSLKLYVGAWYAQGRLEATLSDGSGPAYINSSLNNNAGGTFGVYTISYKSGSPAQTLKIRFTILNQYFPPNGNIALKAATLQ